MFRVTRGAAGPGSGRLVGTGASVTRTARAPARPVAQPRCRDDAVR